MVQKLWSPVKMGVVSGKGAKIKDERRKTRDARCDMGGER